jgi:aminoglycoside/choline kinase family phosphotransferase
VSVPRPKLLPSAFVHGVQAVDCTLMRDVLANATNGFIDRYQDQLADEDPVTLHEVAAVLAEWQLARPDPFSLIHGDYRLDNLLFGPDDDDVVAVDWQTAALGPPLRDVAYLLGTSLEPDQRRASEQALVEEYHHGLVAGGVDGYDVDRCWDDYRLGHLQGPMITVIGCMYATGDRTDRSDAMFLAMARRSCAAIRDLRSLELL